MGISLSQNLVIYNLNKYLEYNGLPLRLNKRGVCLGLTVVHTKYVLQGYEEKFFTMLEDVAQKNPSDEVDSFVNHFVTEVVLAQNPDLFDKELSQADATSLLAIENKQAFMLGISTSDEKMAAIIGSLDIQEKEVLQIESMKHAISITRKDGKYIVYDPNYESGKKAFSSEKNLVDELRNNVFYYTTAEQLNVSLKLFCPQLPLPRKLPEKKHIYQQCLANATTSESSQTFDTLVQAIILDDIESVEILVGMRPKILVGMRPIATEERIDYAICWAISRNRLKVLDFLVSQKSTNEERKNMMYLILALNAGKKNSFDAFLKIPRFEETFQKIVTSHLVLGQAIAGGNLALIRYIIERQGEHLQKNIFLKDHKGQDAINIAIKNRSVDAMHLLLNDESPKTIVSPLEQLRYLKQAIETNHPDMVDFFLQKISPEDIKKITMSTAAVQKTNITILKKLQAAGLPFREIAAAIIKQKENMPIGLRLTMGINMMKFTDFCKKFLRDVLPEIVVNKMALFKERMSEIKINADSNEPKHEESTVPPISHI